MGWIEIWDQLSQLGEDKIQWRNPKSYHAENPKMTPRERMKSQYLGVPVTTQGKWIWLAPMRMQVRYLASLRSSIAGSPSLGTSICCGWGPKKTKKKKKKKEKERKDTPPTHLLVINIRIYLWTLKSVPPSYMFILMSIQSCSDYCSLYKVLRLGNESYPALFFFKNYWLFCVFWIFIYILGTSCQCLQKSLVEFRWLLSWIYRFIWRELPS